MIEFTNIIASIIIIIVIIMISIALLGVIFNLSLRILYTIHLSLEWLINKIKEYKAKEL